MDYSLITGLSAVIISFVAYSAQIYQILKTKKAKDLSSIAYLSLFIQLILWLIYNYYQELYVAFYGNVMLIVLVSIIIILKYYYSKKNNNVVIPIDLG